MFTLRPRAIKAGKEGKQSVIDYDFEAVNLTDYKMEICLPLDNKFFLKLFEDAKKNLVKKKPGLSDTLQDSSIDKIESFAVDSRYLNLIKTFIKTQINGVAREVGADGISVLNEKVTGVIFQKQSSGDWKIKITVEGQYAKQ